MINVNTKIKKTRAKAKIDDEWPDEHFERARDQCEYDILRIIGRDLDLDMNSILIDEAMSYIETVKKKSKGLNDNAK
ncbi:12138_t:CDS:1, partial [Cetraspora pellucida]